MNIFDVVTDKEGHFIFDCEQVQQNLRLYQQQRPGFFTPYQSSQDFAWTMALPLTAPFTLNLIAGLFTVAASTAALAFTGGLFFSACTALCAKEETAKNLLIYSLVGLAVSVASTILASLCVTASLVAACAAGAQVVTRSAATLLSHYKNDVPNQQFDEQQVKSAELAPPYAY